nr:MAG TPA: hypothetical protein [Caudoviricetes sp.]
MIIIWHKILCFIGLHEWAVGNFGKKDGVKLTRRCIWCWKTKKQTNLSRILEKITWGE